MHKISLLKCFVLGGAFSNLMACQQVDHAFTTEADSSSQNIGDSPMSDLPPVPHLSADVPADCATFLMKPPTIDHSATLDKDIARNDCK